MGRAGILYSHVANAAAALVAEDKNPTVDTVREALGGTGSKSTIAPMLKRWKAEHQDQVAAQDASLPANLVQAVKSLYEQMQTGADIQIAAIRTAATDEKQAFENELQAMREKTVVLLKERDSLAEDLAKQHGEYAQLEKTFHQLQLAHTKVQAETAGLQQRLVDRQNEADGLHRQLDQVRTQFEHYQESTAQQRAAERQQAEQARQRLEGELAEVRKTAAALNASLVQRDVELRHATQEKERVATEFTTLQSSFAALQAERSVQDDQLKDASAREAQLRAQIDAQAIAIAYANTELATVAAEKPQLLERINQLDVKVYALQDENRTLAIDKARLEGLHSKAVAQSAGAA